jgi:hypothetical protein
MLTFLIGIAVAQVFPEQMISWDRDPRVVICEGSGIEPGDVQLALVLIGKQAEVRVRGCGCDLLPNQIVFPPASCYQLQTTQDGGMERGKTFMFFGKTMKRALLFVDSPETILVAHELGHAYGYLHSALPGHVMYRTSEGAGLITIGME